jgi:hypothetical protein
MARYCARRDMVRTEEQNMSDKQHEAAEELFQHRNDPDEWETEEEHIEARPARTSVVSFRLPAEEMELLDQAAKGAGQTLSEYIRTAITMRRLHGDAEMPPTFNISYGSQFIVQRDDWKTWNTARASAHTDEMKQTA